MQSSQDELKDNSPFISNLHCSVTKLNSLIINLFCRLQDNPNLIDPKHSPFLASKESSNLNDVFYLPPIHRQRRQPVELTVR